MTPPQDKPRRGRPPARSTQRPARPPRRRPLDPARQAAFDVLRAVSERDAYPNLLLPVLLRERKISGRDAAFATELDAVPASERRTTVAPQTRISRASA